MTPPLLRTGVGSPSRHYRYGALRQRCTARRTCCVALHICVCC